MNRKDEESLVSNCELLKAMAHPVRLCILKQLIENPNNSVGELQCCACVSQSSVSQHLAKLRDLGLVTYKRDGNMIYYSVSNNKVAGLIGILFKD